MSLEVSANFDGQLVRHQMVPIAQGNPIYGGKPLWRGTFSAHLVRNDGGGRFTLIRIGSPATTQEKSIQLPIDVEDLDLDEDYFPFYMFDEDWLMVDVDEGVDYYDGKHMMDVRRIAARPEKSRVIIRVDSRTHPGEYFVVDFSGGVSVLPDEDRDRADKFMVGVLMDLRALIPDYDLGLKRPYKLLDTQTTIVTQEVSPSTYQYLVVSYIKSKNLPIEPFSYRLLTKDKGQKAALSADFIGSATTVALDDVVHVDVLATYGIFVLVTKDGSIYFQRYWADALGQGTLFDGELEEPGATFGGVSNFSSVWKLGDKQRNKKIGEGQPKKRRINKTSGERVGQGEVTCWRSMCNVVDGVIRPIPKKDKDKEMEQANRKLWLIVKRMPACERQREILTRMRKNPPVINCGETLLYWLIDFAASLDVNIQ